MLLANTVDGDVKSTADLKYADIIPWQLDVADNNLVKQPARTSTDVLTANTDVLLNNGATVATGDWIAKNISLENVIFVRAAASIVRSIEKGTA